MNDQSFTAYIIGAVAALVFLGIAALISNAIKFEGGSNPKDKQKRKIWYWVFGVLTPIVTFVIGFFFVRANINVPTLQEKFTTALGIATGCSFVLYILLGLIISKIFKHGKVGQWF